MSEASEQVTIPVSGMTCAACQSFVQRTLEQQPGVEQASVNLLLNSAKVVFHPDQTSAQDLVEAIRETGYGAELPSAAESLVREQEEEAASQAREFKALRLKAAVSVVVGAVMMALAMRHWAMPAGYQPLSFIFLSVTLFIMIWAGRRFYVKAWNALKHRTSDMNTLIALGTGAAFLYSAAVTVAPSFFVRHGVASGVYYETVVFIIGLILTGNALESRAKVRTTEALRKLANLQPETARVEHDGQETEIPVAAVRGGDTILIRPGDRIPVDGIVIEGRSSANESMLTGESIPVEKEPGSTVIGGTLNTSGFLKIRATTLGAASTLGRIVRLLRDAQSSRAPVQKLADRISAIFVPTVVVIAIVTLGAWLALAGPGAFVRAFSAAITVLVIACPCAMGLAVPTAVMAATGRAAQHGILIKGGEPLQKLQSIDTVVLDKTGTVTEGKPSVVAVHVIEGEEAQILRASASLEKLSEHPLAEAVVSYAKQRDIAFAPAIDFEALAGRGAKAVVDGRAIAVGNTRLMEELRIDTAPAEHLIAAFAEQGQTPVLAAMDGRLAAVFAIADQVKSSSGEAIDKLKHLGLKLVLLTGDHRKTAAAIAAHIGIENVIAGVLPEGKVEEVRQLQQEGHVVAMVGDGVNDAPVLAQADVGIAMATGSEIAMEAGDVTLMSGQLTGVLDVLRLARKTMRVMKQNLFWAFAYNVIGIPVAAGLLYPFFGTQLSPEIASGAMALSSVSVVMNSLRLAR